MNLSQTWSGSLCHVASITTNKKGHPSWHNYNFFGTRKKNVCQGELLVAWGKLCGPSALCFNRGDARWLDASGSWELHAGEISPMRCVLSLALPRAAPLHFETFFKAVITGSFSAKKQTQNIDALGSVPFHLRPRPLWRFPVWYEEMFSSSLSGS